ncbi:MAG: HAMP domain-containing histidine kinase [Planctomycetota bacterium]|nr:HAMP domain-containing histidine kinase [Planctomycetaceae bacterium]MDQ3332051.1 HAMP domain-containing histidine kinase [Planctomycetota bacterium]
MTATSPPTLPNLNALAVHLLKRRETILASWRRRVDHAPHNSNAAKLAGREFYDHVPAVLNELHAALVRHDTSDHPAVQSASGHGAHRWQQGLDLRQMTREWGHLHQALLREVDGFAGSSPDAEMLSTAHRIISAVIHEGVTQSVCEFHRLQRLEAEARAKDLEQILSRHVEEGRSRGESLRAASHDLRGSLSIIRSAADILDGAVNEDERVEMVGLIRTAADDLRAMLTSLLDLARLEAGLEERRDEPFDAAELLRELCRTSRPLADSKRLKLAAHGPVSLAVRGDRLKVRRIVQNLLLNALKYTDVGGVEVCWQGEPHRRWSFCVRDTGPGLPAGTAANLEGELADVTSKAREASAAPECPPGQIDLSGGVGESRPEDPTLPASVDQHGEGIGLAIVRRLCELLDATLELETQQGRGTTFHVVLPRDYDE